MLMSMIISLSIAHLLKGVARIIEHPSRKKIYWVHLLWVVYLFMLITDFWWWEVKLKKVPEWNYGYYIFIVLYIICFYISSSLLFPDDLQEYDGYKSYFYSRKQWFFGLLGLLFVLDIGDTLIKGKTYYASLGNEYPVRIALHFILCLAAIKIRQQRFHEILVIAFIAYGISWILRRYLFVDVV
jgi:hypothetical protein